MKIKYTIRNIQPRDIVPLSYVYRCYFSQVTRGREPWPLGQAQKRMTELLRQSRVYGWVAVVSGWPIGFIFFQIKTGFKGEYVELLETAVHHFFDGLEIHEALIAKLKKYIQKKKIHLIYTILYDSYAHHKKLLTSQKFRPSRRSLVYRWK
jgi:hypothetical protein